MAKENVDKLLKDLGTPIEDPHHYREKAIKYGAYLAGGAVVAGLALYAASRFGLGDKATLAAKDAHLKVSWAYRALLSSKTVEGAKLFTKSFKENFRSGALPRKRLLDLISGDRASEVDIFMEKGGLNLHTHPHADKIYSQLRNFAESLRKQNTELGDQLIEAIKASKQRKKG